MAEPTKMPFGSRTRVSLKNHVLDGGPDPPWTEAILRGKSMSDDTDVNCAKTAESIDLPFGLWTRVGRRKHKFNRIRQVAPMCAHGRAYWRHMANTTEPSVCDDDVSLCQITLTACFILSFSSFQRGPAASQHRSLI